MIDGHRAGSLFIQSQAIVFGWSHSVIPVAAVGFCLQVPYI